MGQDLGNTTSVGINMMFQIHDILQITMHLKKNIHIAGWNFVIFFPE